MAKDQLSINLLGNKNASIADQFLTWALAIGRLLVIVTETVALATFLYRFSIDRQLIDLHDEITKNQAIVAYLKQGEDSYRHMQQKIAISQKNDIATQKIATIFSTVMKLGNEHTLTFNKLVSSYQRLP
jgi:hypothetical protein